VWSLIGAILGAVGSSLRSRRELALENLRLTTRAAVGTKTQLVGVRIDESFEMKAYAPGEMPVLRGLAAVQDDRSAYLWTRGFAPRLRTYPGAEVPNPLRIDVCRGSALIDLVLRYPSGGPRRGAGG